MRHTATGRMAAVASIFLALLLSRAQAGSELLLDNAVVRVFFSTFAPGEPSGEHEHAAPRFVYVVSDGTLESVTGDGPPQRVTLAAATCMYAAPVWHSVTNAGESTLRLAEFELKRASGPGEGRTVACDEPQKPEKRRAGRVERSVLFSGADFVATRIVIPPGSRDKTVSILGDRVVFVLEGGPLATRQAGGSKALATRDAALWVDAKAALVNQDARTPLVLLEVVPATGPSAAAR